MKTKIFITVIYLCALSTLPMPYRNMFNFAGSPNLPAESDLGYEFFLTVFSMTALMISTIMVYVSSSRTWPLVFSLINLFIVWLIRFEIHYQGIDHDNDTKSGAGYYMLFICSILFTFVILADMIYTRKKQPTNQ